MGMGLGGGGSGRHQAMSDINVTPLVDIMLVLLIIFMVTAPLMTQGVDLDLPDANAQAIASDEEPLIVSVTPDGRTYLEERLIGAQELSDKISAIRRTKPNLVVFVRGDREANYGTVMEVMVQLQQAGVKRVGLVTEPEES